MPAPALVLTYHRVASGRDPLLQCVSPTHFADQLEALAGLAEIVPLRDLDHPSATRRLAITFDDGYRDNATEAVPLLRAAGAPATFFVPARLVADGGEFWWDRLEHAHLDHVSKAARLTLEIDGRTLQIDVRTAEGLQRSLKTLNRRLRELPLAQIEPVVAAVEAQLGVEVSTCAAHALLTSDDLAALAANPLFEIGGHGTTHTMLSALTPAEQRVEIDDSRSTLEGATGHLVTSFAYPYGTPESFDAATSELVERAGYERAFGNSGGIVDARRHRFDLSRHMVYDWTGEDLAHRVRGWFSP